MNANDSQLPQFSRRHFLRACAAVGTGSLFSAITDLRLINAAVAQTSGLQGYKALVCVFLYGGNDANNLIVPTGQADYDAYALARQGLAIPSANLLPVTPLNSDGRTFGLHPACTGLKQLFDAQKLAILCNVGTLVYPVTRAQYMARSVPLPPQLFSHNDQQVQWQSSVPDQPMNKTGWGGRMADLLHSVNVNSPISMSISVAGTNTWEVGSSIQQYQVTTTGAVTLSSLSTGQLKALKDIAALPKTHIIERNANAIVERAIANGDLLNANLANVPAFLNDTAAFPNTRLGNQLRMVAKLIAARDSFSMKRQIFFCSMDGFDTHGEQINSQATLLGDMSNALKAFYDAISNPLMNVANDVTTFTASDFGRTFPSNGVGSDHGWGSHHLVMGGAVQGGRLIGEMPALVVNGPNDTGLGRWIPTTSVDEYSATLARWFGVSSTDMPVILPNLGRFQYSDLGFMVG